MKMMIFSEFFIPTFCQEHNAEELESLRLIYSSTVLVPFTCKLVFGWKSANENAKALLKKVRWRTGIEHDHNGSVTTRARAVVGTRHNARAVDKCFSVNPFSPRKSSLCGRSISSWCRCRVFNQPRFSVNENRQCKCKHILCLLPWELWPELWTRLLLANKAWSFVPDYLEDSIRTAKMTD